MVTLIAGSVTAEALAGITRQRYDWAPTTTGGLRRVHRVLLPVRQSSRPR